MRQKRISRSKLAAKVIFDVFPWMVGHMGGYCHVSGGLGCGNDCYARQPSIADLTNFPNFGSHTYSHSRAVLLESP